MPQTEEEHLENQNLDYEDQEKTHPDAEVINKLLFASFATSKSARSEHANIITLDFSPWTSVYLNESSFIYFPCIFFLLCHKWMKFKIKYIYLPHAQNKTN